MKQILTFILCASATVLFGASSAQAIVIGAFDATRAGNGHILGGPYTDESVAAITANFSDVAFVTTPVLTSEFLASVDVLLLAPVKEVHIDIAPLSGAEQTALVNFVMAGGNAMLFGEYNHSLPANSYMQPFGVTIAPSTNSLIFVEPTQPDHPVLDGPFGQVPQMLFVITGKLTNLGPYAEEIAANTANGDTEIAVIDRQQMGPNSGRVLFFADCNPFFDSNNTGLASVAEHQALLLNSIHYLAAPEPGTLTLAGIGGLGLLLGAGRFRSTAVRRPLHRSKD